jgi:hypothetical protein
MSTSDALDTKIRSMVIELIESAPPAPAFPEIEIRFSANVPKRRAPWSAPSVHRRAALLGVSAVLVAAALVLALALAPSSVDHQPAASAATELHQIADNAALQPLPQLSMGQYLLTQQNVTFLAKIVQVGSTPTPNAVATVVATIKEWANNQGGSCIVATSGPAEFVSDTNRAAWQAAGLLIDPSGPSTSCELTGTGVMDVANLSTNPTVLAQELSDGTTGIPLLDQQIPGPNAGFDRAAVLLIGPTVRATPTLYSALFDALAKMAGVSALGSVTTHTGLTGLGFSVPSGLGRSVIVVDPSTGALLEAQNIPDQSAFAGFGGVYLAPPPTPSISTEGGTTDVTIKQIDPIGVPSVAKLPAGLAPPVPLGSSGTITAIAKPSVTIAQINALAPQLQIYGKAGVSVSVGPSSNTFVAVYSFNGSQHQINEYDNVLKDSGLFASVIAKLGSH